MSKDHDQLSLHLVMLQYKSSTFLPFDVVYRCQPTLAEFMSPFLDHKSFSGFICEKCCEQISFDVVLVYLKTQLHLSGLRASGVQDAKWLRAD